MQTLTVKLNDGRYMHPVQLWKDRGQIWFSFDYNLALQAEIKSMSGAKWHGFEKPPLRNWSVEDNRRNRFQLAYLAGQNPYAPYEQPLDTTIFGKERYNLAKEKMFPLLNHQPSMAAHMLQRHGSLVAGEMGTSKTLAEILAAEIVATRFRFKYGCQPEGFYVAPRSAIRAVEREYHIWGSQYKPEFMTYEAMSSRMKNWPSGKKAPFRVTFDESSKIKNFFSQRSQWAYQLAEGIRNDWPGGMDDSSGVPGLQGYVNLMSGSPAPKSPLDWWSQAEIACPGFLKEGDIYKFKNRLAVIIQKESIQSGGTYPELVTWRNDPAKCHICGELVDHKIHSDASRILGDLAPTGSFKPHAFVESINEVEKLYHRLQGLTIVYFKKDCLDLPEKTYRTIEIKPSPSLLRAAKLIAANASTTIGGLTLLRELSDGFQYRDVEDGTQQCPACVGTGTVLEYQSTSDLSRPISVVPVAEGAVLPSMEPIQTRIKCPHCKGTGQSKKYERIVESVKCPKDDIVKDLLDEYSDIGRTVFFAGFTGSIDRVVDICLKQKWAVIRLDESKERVYDSEGKLLARKDYLHIFQDLKDEFPQVAYVAHPRSGGMGTTLTESPMAAYFSNTFDGEDRIQSEDRIHRMGMDLNLGATIYDILHLPSDKKVLENIKIKRDLQSMTLGEFIQGETTYAEANR